MTTRHTYDMGVVGNCACMAHIDSSGRIVWMCLPRFDSSSVFGYLLDRERGGEFAIHGSGTVTTHQAYVRNTNVLVTEIQGEDGAFRITDCIPRFRQYDRFFKPLMLIRKLEPLVGSPKVKVVCRPRGRYGQTVPHAHLGSNHIRYDFGRERLRLNTNVALSYIEGERYFVLGDTKFLVLTWGVPFEAPLQSTAEEYIRETIAYWKLWVHQCSIGRFYQKEVIRSALVLKLHQFEDTGAIIAAGTTSLPEYPNSKRNWDYRYCWLRDAYYTLNALNRISQFEEMQKFAHFVENIAASIETAHYPPVVSIDGALELPEKVIDLAGYDGAGCVRVGNAAYTHVQNDIYGQIIFALLQLYIDERFPRELRRASTELIMTLLRKIEATLGKPDNTLWEFRQTPQCHSYTAAFHWVGSKAAAKIARQLEHRDMRRLATKLVARSAREVDKAYDPSLRAYVQEAGSKRMDASLLQLISLHFLDPRSERAAHHLAGIERELVTPDGLVYRYVMADDFGRPRSTFLVCAFWYVEALAIMGRVDEALRVLDGLLKHANHLGLFSEDIDPETFSQWGNFPQTYSHVGLMSAVFHITSQIDYPEFF